MVGYFVAVGGGGGGVGGKGDVGGEFGVKFDEEVMVVQEGKGVGVRGGGGEGRDVVEGRGGCECWGWVSWIMTDWTDVVFGVQNMVKLC